MKMLINDATENINRLPEDRLRNIGYTKEGLLQLQEKENAAIVLCGGMLGNCYLMAEIVDWLFHANGENLEKRFKSQKWFKQEIKMHVNLALNELRMDISASKNGSLCDKDYMMSVADNLYDIIELDIKKLHNAFLLELGTKIKHDPIMVAWLMVVDLLMQWVGVYYDHVIKQMKNIFSRAEYHSWYSHARMTNVSAHLANALKEYEKKYIDKDIDIRNSTIIMQGIAAIDRAMNSPEITKKLNEQSIGYSGDDQFDEALEMFGLNQEQLEEKPKKRKSLPRVPIEEQVEVEMTARDILSQKYKVI